MVTYSIKDLMGLCTDYALDAQIQKRLFSFDLWIPKAAREVHIDNVTQQRHATAAFTGFSRARSPTRNDSTNNSNDVTNRLRRTFALRSMSAEVFRSSIDTGCSRITSTNELRDSNKTTTTSTNILLIKKSSNGQNLDDGLSTGQSQVKLMPILESAENEDKIMMTTTTLDWTPAENESTASRASIDALFELSVRADSALKTALCENDAMAINVSKTNSNSDRITLRKSVSVMNQKKRTGSGRSLIRAKSDMTGTDGNRKRTLTQIVRNSERYFSDDPKTIADIEELELEYLFNYIRHLKTFPKYTQMTEDEILQEVESDPHTLRQRTKEILKGKMSDSYANYLTKYPLKKQRLREHPTTPNKYRKCSRRCFDGQLRTWRRNLHQFDEESKQGTTDPSEIDGLII
ncbi:unnamed protein product [Rotaria magnacalcarata]|uniref:Histone RNA hairpin-binding protein RNA-binding domain-containing protein n=2 Tax=Rotaria magnacalcarata TaxID=392030 RepID=A0A820B461_9BILA|nr:unnamed protein product [Rotaria magnacalcarata]CAF2071251.1 unnamed protein product [Rotaria magnacalcarata]CAF4192516.1 unnamed protein product [Rotaria magnacalcarata]CAF4200458.1 unnamed protein product [Rotaria magnacalcarata]